MKKWLIITLFIFLTTQLQTKVLNNFCKKDHTQQCYQSAFNLDFKMKKDYKSIQSLDQTCLNGANPKYCSKIAKIYAKYQDYSNTITYYQMNCNEEKTDSCYELGKFYLVQYDNSDTSNYEYYLAISCEDGNQNACRDLGIHLEVQNSSQSKFYYEKACFLGLKEYCH